jgi:hypothetical protein
VNELLLKIDLHVHTCHSTDAGTTPKEVVAYSKKRGLDGVAVTDHDTLKGALKLTNQEELLVIPGIEVTTSDGHVLALNVREKVLPKLTLSETIRRIHELGGIAVAAHPKTIFGGIGQQITSSLGFDAIEVINSLAFPFFFSTYMSRKVALRLNLPQIAGSDAHYPSEIGFAYTIVDADPEVDEIMRAIRRGATVPCGRPIPWKLRLEREYLRLKRSINKCSAECL